MPRKFNFEIDEKTPLLKIAGPLFFEMLLTTLLHSVDTLMLSHYNELAVGAVGNVSQVMAMLGLFFGIISLATSVVVAQYLGAKQFAKMNRIYTLAVIVNLAVGIVLCGAVVALAPRIMAWLNVSDEMRPFALTYIRIVGAGMFMQAVYRVMSQILRCNGFTKIGLYVSIGMNAVNIGGNYLFLYGALKHLGLGVAGVAISTVVANAVALVIAFHFFFSRRIGRLSLRYLKPFPLELLWQMVKIGLPSAGEQLSYNFYQMCLLAFINKMGNDAVNAKIYCYSLIHFAFLFANAAAMGTQIIVGHLVGAGKEDEAYSRVFRTLRISMPITLAITLANWLLSPWTLRWFTANEAIVAMSWWLMFVDIFIEAGRCLNLTFIYSLRAAGSYVFPLIIGLATMWGIGLTLGYGLGVAAGIGVAGVFIGTAADECVRGLVVMYYWWCRKWSGKALVEKA